MILTDKNNSKVIIECDCGSESIGINKLEFNNGDKEYYLDFSINTFYSYQENIFSKLKRRIKFAWSILTKGTYRFQEIVLTKDDFQNLKDVIKDFE